MSVRPRNKNLMNVFSSSFEHFLPIYTCKIWRIVASCCCYVLLRTGNKINNKNMLHTMKTILQTAKRNFQLNIWISLGYFHRFYLCVCVCVPSIDIHSCVYHDEHERSRKLHCFQHLRKMCIVYTMQRSNVCLELKLSISIINYTPNIRT